MGGRGVAAHAMFALQKVDTDVFVVAPAVHRMLCASQVGVVVSRVMHSCGVVDVILSSLGEGQVNLASLTGTSMPDTMTPGTTPGTVTSSAVVGWCATEMAAWGGAVNVSALARGG